MRCGAARAPGRLGIRKEPISEQFFAQRRFQWAAAESPHHAAVILRPDATSGGLRHEQHHLHRRSRRRRPRHPLLPRPALTHRQRRIRPTKQNRPERVNAPACFIFFLETAAFRRNHSAIPSERRSRTAQAGMTSVSGPKKSAVVAMRFLAGERLLRTEGLLVAERLLVSKRLLGTERLGAAEVLARRCLALSRL